MPLQKWGLFRVFVFFALLAGGSAPAGFFLFFSFSALQIICILIHYVYGHRSVLRCASDIGAAPRKRGVGLKFNLNNRRPRGVGLGTKLTKAAMFKIWRLFVLHNNSFLQDKKHFFCTGVNKAAVCVSVLHTIGRKVRLQ
jgi:hypothetical protein